MLWNCCPMRFTLTLKNQPYALGSFARRVEDSASKAPQRWPTATCTRTEPPATCVLKILNRETFHRYADWYILASQFGGGGGLYIASSGEANLDADCNVYSNQVQNGVPWSTYIPPSSNKPLCLVSLPSARCLLARRRTSQCVVLPPLCRAPTCLYKRMVKSQCATGWI